MQCVRRSSLHFIRECYLAGVDLAQAQIRSECRTLDRRLIASGQVSLQNQTTQAGWFFIDYGPTDGWPLGDLYIDVVMQAGGEAHYSPIYKIRVTEGVTDEL